MESLERQRRALEIIIDELCNAYIAESDISIEYKIESAIECLASAVEVLDRAALLKKSTMHACRD